MENAKLIRNCLEAYALLVPLVVNHSDVNVVEKEQFNTKNWLALLKFNASKLIEAVMNSCQDAEFNPEDAFQALMAATHLTG